MKYLSGANFYSNLNFVFYHFSLHSLLQNIHVNTVEWGGGGGVRGNNPQTIFAMPGFN